jgi:hypothetical protein
MDRRFLFCIIALFAFVSVTMAQITLTAESFRTVGQTGTVYLMDDANVTAGPGGANQQWTLLDYSSEDSVVMDIVDPTTMPLANDFPTATRAQHSIMTMGPITMHIYMAERIEETGYYQLGEVTGYDTSWYSQVYEPEVFNAPLPCTYGTTYTRVKTVPDGDNLEEADSSLNVVDGWGTMTTPFGTSNVLRVFSHIYIKVRTISTGYEQVVETAGFMWIDEHGAAVVTMESNGTGADPNFTNADLRMVRYTPTAVEPARGPVASSFAVGQNYPNPFNPTTSLPVSLTQTSQVTVDIYNAAGQLVSHEVQALTAGSHSLPINGAAWSTGTYFARVSAPGQSATTKMQLLK